MKFNACPTFVFLSFMVGSVLSQSGGQSNVLLDFLSTISGRFINSKQVASEVAHKDKIKHDALDITFFPIDIPALRSSSKVVTFYFLERDNDQVNRKEILVTSVSDDGVITMQPYNLTDFNRFGDELPDPADLASLKPEDLASPKNECSPVFREVSSGIFSGQFPDCINFINGISMAYLVTLTCDSISGTISWKGAPENMSPIPYTMLKQKRFPLPDSATKDAGDWVSPCGIV